MRKTLRSLRKTGEFMTHIASSLHRKIHIKKDAAMWLFLVLLTLPHMSPEYLDQLPEWEGLLDILKLASFAIIVFWIIVFKRRISAVPVLISAWEIFLFMTTWIHGGEVYWAATSAFSTLAIIFLYDAACDKGETFLSAQLFCFELVVYINLCTIFMYPSGMYSNPPEYYTKNWFLGYYNMYTRYFVPALMFGWLYMRHSRKKVRTYLLTISIFYTAFKVWSGGEIVLLLTMAIVYVFFKNRTTVCNYYSYWSLHIVFFIALFVFRLQYILKWIIDGLLGKWTSLVSRMDLWDKTYELFLKYPIIGHGIQDANWRRVEYGYIYGAHAHNLIWELLYQGGITGIVLWSSIVIISGIRVFKFRQSEDSKIIALAFLGWCVATLVEPYMSPFLMGMFVIAHRGTDGNSLREGERAATRQKKHRLKFNSTDWRKHES